MQKSILGFAILGIAVLGGVFWIYSYAGQGDGQRPVFPHSRLTITRADGKVLSFDVEVARTQAEQAYGLMFIHSMAADAGMVFPYDPPRDVAFWMKNTLIPLDMLFVGSDHTIEHIITNAKPQDVTPLGSQMPVAAVIEINGGMAEKDGIAVGDKIVSSDFP